MCLALECNKSTEVSKPTSNNDEEKLKSIDTRDRN